MTGIEELLKRNEEESRIIDELLHDGDLEREVLTLVAAATHHVEALAAIHRKLAELPKSQVTVDGLTANDPVRLAATLIRRATKSLTHDEKLFAHPMQGWEA